MAVRKAAWRRLNGLFAVYKPSGVASLRVRDSVETLLLKELNSLEQPDMPQHVRFLPTTVEGNAGKELTLTVTQLPVLAAHPLVRGPNFTHLKIGVGHRLDTKSSGVLVLGVGHGNKLLTDLYDAHLTRAYTVRGLFGKATDDFSDTGKLIEKTTFDHVTRDKLERILAVIQGTNHKALLMYSKIDLKTQEAYELAVEGLIRPMEKTPPLITAIQCLQFAPPEFQLGDIEDVYNDSSFGEPTCLPLKEEMKIQCLHETQKYLRKVVHEIGLELKSTAVCTQVRRTRDGFFTLDSALLRTHWNLRNIQKSIQDSKIKVQVELQRNLGHQAKGGERHTSMDQVTESELHRTEGISASNISPYAD